MSTIPIVVGDNTNPILFQIVSDCTIAHVRSDPTDRLNDSRALLGSFQNVTDVSIGKRVSKNDDSVHLKYRSHLCSPIFPFGPVENIAVLSGSENETAFGPQISMQVNYSSGEIRYQSTHMIFAVAIGNVGRLANVGKMPPNLVVEIGRHVNINRPTRNMSIDFGPF
jgi:hypothetical protein